MRSLADAGNKVQPKEITFYQYSCAFSLDSTSNGTPYVTECKKLIATRLIISAELVSEMTLPLSLC